MSYLSFFVYFCFSYSNIHIQAALVIRGLYYLRIRLITLTKLVKNDIFLVKNGLFIFEFRIRSPKWRNVSSANNERNLYFYTYSHILSLLLSTYSVSLLSLSFALSLSKSHTYCNTNTLCEHKHKLKLFCLKETTFLDVQYKEREIKASDRHKFEINNSVRR